MYHSNKRTGEVLMKQSMLEKRSATARKLGGIRAVRKLPFEDRLVVCAAIITEAGKPGLARKFAEEAVQVKKEKRDYHGALLIANEYGLKVKYEEPKRKMPFQKIIA
jgi:hypothetical protein